MAQDSNDNKNIRRFDGSLSDDITDYHIKENQWTHMRNGTVEYGTNNVTNEPANKSCITTSYTIIGYIYLYDDLWAIFSTDDTNHEIGLFKEFTCNYTILVKDDIVDFAPPPCLNFNRNNLITGIAKQNFDCTWNIYWADGYRNPDRVLNINNIPWKGGFTFDTNECQVFVKDEPIRIDCDKLRLNRPIVVPCLSLKRSSNGGNLLNGSYYATIAYTVNGQKVTNYLGLSNVAALFTHGDLYGGLELDISALDESFDEYELVIISVTGSQSTVARRMGLYSTNQKHVFLDIISNELPIIPLEFLPVHNSLMDSSASITDLGNTMLRIAPRSKFDFNYQPLANQIIVNWVSVEYDADYYRNGGVNLNALRDENAALFIRWLYDDSDRSPSFHLPGRGPLVGEQSVVLGIDDPTYHFENVNTAQQVDISIFPLDDGGYQIAEGFMGYYETDELYPVNKPTVWTNLCGKKIRHHKFPDRSLTDRTNIYTDNGISSPGAKIRVMGVKLYNIRGPVDNHGIPIPGIIGYEVLRGSRDGNRTIIAKGIINNLFNYDLENSTKEGVYPNFPYNSLEPDPYISRTQGMTDRITGVLSNITPNPTYYTSLFTFHSPDTTFRRPFLGVHELKIDGIVSGSPLLKFYEPSEHPKHKMLTNFAYFISAIAGLGLAVLKMSGPRGSSNGLPNIGGTTGATVLGTTIGLGVILAKVIAARQDNDNIDKTYDDYGDVVKARDPNIDSLDASDRNQANQLNTVEGQVMTSANKQSIFGGGLGNALGSLFRAVGGFSLFSQQWSEGIDTVIEILSNFSQWQQYALQQISHCFYNEYGNDSGVNPAPTRFAVETAKYLDPVFQEFDDTLTINNLYRARTVAIKVVGGFVPTIESFDSNLKDTSKQTLHTLPNPLSGIYDEPAYYFAIRKASSYYASLKIRLRNQYGQIGDIKQIPVGCPISVNMDFTNSNSNMFSSPVLFVGDTYITRYTEKNTMFFFYDWMYKQFDGAEFDYFKHRMHKFPSYWINTNKIDIGDFVRGLTDTLGGQVVSLVNPNLNTQPNANINQNPWLPSGFMSLDRAPGSMNVSQTSGGLSGFLNVNATAYKNSLFIVKSAYFYLFVSGIRDFYVESEVNLGYRDWEEPLEKRFYDSETYTDLVGMFKADPDIIKADNFYKYDYSLSASKSFVNMISWGTMQPTYYNPIIAETCYTFHPKRFIYSLPQQFEQIRDSWRVFLANNYKDFRSKITTIKSIGDNGAIILFESDRPTLFQGTETLETVRGTKLTIGDGELFDKPQQNLTNSDHSYQYGSCQNLRSVINTPMGLFFISPKQGKIFTVADGLLNIAIQDMNWWFYKYLPFRILEDFPNFDNLDNSITGVGCQSVYDNKNEIIYFTKTDYKFKGLNLSGNSTVFYDPITKRIFLNESDSISGGGGGGGGDSINLVLLPLSDPLYFENVSWTVSYDIKNKRWLGHQDWHPHLTLPSQITFHTTKDNGIWQHNVRCDLYCNYYGIDYPFEIEYTYNTGIQVNTLRSVEYYLEVYKYAANCNDRYLYLNENFDEAIIWNNEQCSGLLKLNLSPMDNPFLMVNYPIYNLSTVDTIFSKVESKYRIDQFTDVTDDRGEFSNARRMIWNTESNGYVKILNDINLNYQKSPLQHKKFRGYQGYVFLRRKVSGDKKFIFLFAVNKLLESKR